MLRPDASVPSEAADRAALRASMARRAAPVLAGAALCSAGAALVHTSLDETLFRAINAWGPLAPALWSAFTVAGLASAAWIVVAEARPAESRTAARLLWLIVVGGVIVHLLKHAVGLVRPLGALGDAVVHVVGSALRTGSMPSGHSATAAALATLLVIETGWASRRAVAASLGWIALGITICLSRIAVGAHWPSDVLVGAGLGLAVGSLAVHAWPVAAMARAFATRTGRRVIGLTLLLVLVEPFSETTARHYHDARWFAWLLVPLALWGAWQRWRADLAPVEA
jgi:membrane-associated phospholipid phosphatase